MLLVVLLLACVGSIMSQTCTNRYPSQDVRASGDWSEQPIWNALEPKGLMKYDQSVCGHVVTIGGLKPNTNYKWKVVIGNSWSSNFGLFSLSLLLNKTLKLIKVFFLRMHKQC